ncbi:MAG: hypothetical protein ACPGWR_16215, partial [Ardenticatenaceae bacterium]
GGEGGEEQEKYQRLAYFPLFCSPPHRTLACGVLGEGLGAIPVNERVLGRTHLSSEVGNC